MNPVLLGLIGAVSWGVHDVIAARASKGVGAVRAAAVVTLAGLFILSAWLAWQGKFPAGSPNWMWLPLCAGAGIALATIWLFAALAAGSLSLALPIVMSYPVTSLALGTLAGRHPSMLQITAAAVALGGVLAVARSESAGDPSTSGGESFRRTLAFGALSHIAYAVATFAGQHSATVFDPLEATWLARIGGSLTVLPLLFRNAAELPRVVGRWLPALMAMGGLDVLAIAMINLAALTTYPEMALVAASSAGVISILLARVLFQEHIAAQRWIGIIVTFAGIAALTAVQ
jgi:drug/metabolite transporter (DMT)-like permease